MKPSTQDIIKSAYQFFNARNIPGALQLMTEDVHWPNGWEGGYVYGHEAVKEYWTRQWKELNPIVEPVDMTIMPNNTVAVLVHQKVSDFKGNIIFDGKVKHTYTMQDNLISRMEIEK